MTAARLLLSRLKLRGCSASKKAAACRCKSRPLTCSKLVLAAVNDVDRSDGWIEVATDVFRRDGTPRREARTRAELLVSAVEGALILARVRQSKQPILDVARLF